MDTEEAAALSAFPELQRLVELRRLGRWQWRADHVAGEIQGLLFWESGEVDAIAVRASGDAKSLRLLPGDGVVWQRTGGLREVADGLLELPAPGTRLAPRLVKDQAPSLWTA